MREEVSKLGSEVRALRREMRGQATPEASPPSLKLPLNTLEEFQRAEALVRDTPAEKQKMVGLLTLYLCIPKRLAFDNCQLLQG